MWLQIQLTIPFQLNIKGGLLETLLGHPEGLILEGKTEDINCQDDWTIAFNNKNLVN